MSVIHNVNSILSPHTHTAQSPRTAWDDVLALGARADIRFERRDGRGCLGRGRICGRLAEPLHEARQESSGLVLEPHGSGRQATHVLHWMERKVANSFSAAAVAEYRLPWGTTTRAPSA